MVHVIYRSITSASVHNYHICTLIIIFSTFRTGGHGCVPLLALANICDCLAGARGNLSYPSFSHLIT